MLKQLQKRYEGRVLFTVIFNHLTLVLSAIEGVPGVLSTLLTSVVPYSLTRATLMSPGLDEIHVCGHVRSEFNH